jgi:hypothetical protein
LCTCLHMSSGTISPPVLVLYVPPDHAHQLAVYTQRLGGLSGLHPAVVDLRMPSFPMSHRSSSMTAQANHHPQQWRINQHLTQNTGNTATLAAPHSSRPLAAGHPCTPGSSNSSSSNGSSSSSSSSSGADRCLDHHPAAGLATTTTSSSRRRWGACGRNPQGLVGSRSGGKGPAAKCKVRSVRVTGI